LGTSICGDLLRKIALDLLVSSGKLQIDGMATVHTVDPTRAGERAIQSSSRHVRTRLYFTSESHIMSLMNILRYAPNKLNELGSGIGIVTTKEGLESISRAHEMNYLSSIVIKLSKQQSKRSDDPLKYKIEIM
jgi:inositol hexakisphosphate/diphosphoinositol-pentakisphosphate kinase